MNFNYQEKQIIMQIKFQIRFDFSENDFLSFFKAEDPAHPWINLPFWQISDITDLYCLNEVKSCIHCTWCFPSPPQKLLCISSSFQVNLPLSGRYLIHQLCSVDIQRCCLWAVQSCILCKWHASWWMLLAHQPWNGRPSSCEYDHPLQIGANIKLDCYLLESWRPKMPYSTYSTWIWLRCPLFVHSY